MSQSVALSLDPDRSSPETRRLLFSIQTIKYVLFWLAVWQDSSVGGSLIQLQEYTGLTHSVRPIEFIIIALFLMLVIERTLSGDFTIRRSYFWAPILVFTAALFISWVRGSWINQSVDVVWEVHEAFEIPFIFFIVLNLFRDPEDGRRLMILIMLGTIAKAVDGATIYFFSHDPGKGWGVLQMWRDGYLLAFGITAMLLMLHYPGGKYTWLKKVMIYSTPVLLFTLIMSFRRTFFLALLVAAISMFFIVGKGHRKRHLLIFLSLLVGLSVVILATDPIGFIGRLLGIISPAEEGSAYIRLMEYPNVIRNIIDNPVFGTAIGTQWHQYWRMPVYANFTTVGTHNTYLYWPLRTGILGTVGFFWLLGRAWKVALIEHRLARTNEERFFSHLQIQALVIYMVGCFFGLMYGDAMTSLLAMLLTASQLNAQKMLGLQSLRKVDFLKTISTKQLVLKP
jgi:O-Antigen ligase